MRVLYLPFLCSHVHWIIKRLQLSLHGIKWTIEQLTITIKMDILFCLLHRMHVLFQVLVRTSNNDIVFIMLDNRKLWFGDEWWQVLACFLFFKFTTRVNDSRFSLVAWPCAELGYWPEARWEEVVLACLGTDRPTPKHDLEAFNR